MDINNQDWMDAVSFDDKGLVPAIAQDHESGRVLMFAWMNPDTLRETVSSGRAVYWSRSRQVPWKKGEESGHEQLIKDIQLDCDGDVIILKVEQAGGIACHTGRNSCFFRSLSEDGWQETEPVLKNPEDIYPDG